MFKWETKYGTLDEIPEDCRGAYEEKDGKFQIVRALSKTQLENSYNSTKDKLKAATDRLKGVPEDFDLSKLSEINEELEELRAEKEAGSLDGANKEKIDEIVEKRLDTERKKWDREKTKLQGDLDAATTKLGETSGKLKTVSLETRAREIASKHKVQPHSIDDALYRVSQDFDLDDDGQVVDKSEAGRTLDDWFAETVPTKPGWTFAPEPGGTGAQPGSGKHGGPRTVKRSEADKLAVENPSKAKELMASVSKGEVQLVD